MGQRIGYCEWCLDEYDKGSRSDIGYRFGDDWKYLDETPKSVILSHRDSTLYRCICPPHHDEIMKDLDLMA